MPEVTQKDIDDWLNLAARLRESVRGECPAELNLGVFSFLSEDADAAERIAYQAQMASDALRAGLTVTIEDGERTFRISGTQGQSINHFTTVLENHRMNSILERQPIDWDSLIRQTFNAYDYPSSAFSSGAIFDVGKFIGDAKTEEQQLAEKAYVDVTLEVSSASDIRYILGYVVTPSFKEMLIDRLFELPDGVQYAGKVLENVIETDLQLKLIEKMESNPRLFRWCLLSDFESVTDPDLKLRLRKVLDDAP